MQRVWGESMLQVQVVELQLLLLCNCTQGLSDKAPKLYVAPYSRPDVSDYRYATRHSGERLDGNGCQLITFWPICMSCRIACHALSQRHAKMFLLSLESLQMWMLLVAPFPLQAKSQAGRRLLRSCQDW